MTPDPDFEQVLEEILTRRAAGEQPTPEEYIAKYPRYANQLVEHFETLRVLEELMREEGAAPPPDTILDDYLLLERIGQGGMGVVFLAEQMSLKRNVALKVLGSRLTSSYERLERFRREAEIAAKLRHPNIIAVYAVGESQGYPYFAMEYSRGVSLAGYLQEVRKGGVAALGDLDLSTVVRGMMASKGMLESDPDSGIAERQAGYFGAIATIVAEVADALTYAHARGIIHRDVKPSNIMIDERLSPQLADFGVAKDLGSQAPTITHEPIGTPNYMSPELITTTISKVDFRTDIYSLGITLYELLTLHVPFGGKTSREVQHNILFEAAPPPRRFNPAVPRDLQVIAMKAMEKNPNDRFQSAREMAEDLRRFVRIEPIHAQPPGATEVARRFARRHWIASASIATLALLGLLVWLGYGSVQAGARVESALLGIEQLVSAGSLKEALDRLDAAPPEVRAAAGYPDLRARAAARNAEELESRVKTFFAPSGGADEDYAQSWFSPGQDAVAFQRLRIDDPNLVARIQDVTGPYQVSVACDAPGAAVYVDDVSPANGATRGFRLLGTAPYRGRLPYGVYRFTVVAADGYGEYLRDVQRGGLDLDTTIRPTREVIGGMVEIPAGTYAIGFDYAALLPAHPRAFDDQMFKKPTKREIPAFHIDRTCVTNEEYDNYLKALGYPKNLGVPETWLGGHCPEEHRRKPVLVSWEKARAYAEWKGKRLPMEDEWEAAGRGADGRLFPWGNEPENGRANMQPIGPAFQPMEFAGLRILSMLTDVGAFPKGRTPSGLDDMIGNCVQWTWNPWRPRPEAPSDSPMRMPGERVVRGTDYEDVMKLEHNLARREGMAPNTTNLIGFRCAKSPAPRTR